mgnify:FL=1
MELIRRTRSGNLGILLLGLPILVLLNLSSLYNYLLFHSLAELFAVGISFAIFLLSWNFREFNSMAPVVRLGIGFLFVGLFDIVHVLGYKGMGVLDYGSNPPTQTWILGRYLEAFALFLFVAIPGLTAKIPTFVFKIGYGLLFLVSLLTIYVYPVFPDAFIEGEGQTTFKVVSEFLICAILVLAAGIAHRRLPAYSVLKPTLIGSLLVAAVAELTFTLYQDVYGIANQLGHNFKILSYYLIYLAIVKTQITTPVRSAMSRILNRDVEDVISDHTRDLLGVLAHDLRSPFATLRSTSELLLKMKDSLSEQDREELIEAIYATSRQASGLFDDLSEWVALQMGASIESVDPYSFKSAVEPELDLIRYLASQKKISFKESVDPGLQTGVDPQLVRTIVRNLLNNAIRFTPEGKSVELGVFRHPDGPAGLTITVTDEGQGMSDERRIQILNRRRMQRSTGKGIGLFLCQQLLDRIGGRMEIESQPGQGSRFIVRIPE